MRCLLHVCCAPCSVYPVERLSSKAELAGIYFNPNIHPLMEYKARRDSAVEYFKSIGIELNVADYDINVYFSDIFDGGTDDRCARCWRVRLKETALAARRGGYDTFSSTLLISPYQNHERIRAIASEISEETGVSFYYEDFREGYRYSQETARSRGLYRQKYCGCIFSEAERFANKLKNKRTAE